jgi:hypothetical protein
LSSIDPESSAEHGIAIKVITSDAKSSSDIMGGDGAASSAFAATVSATSTEDATHDSGKKNENILITVCAISVFFFNPLVRDNDNTSSQVSSRYEIISLP